MHLMHYAIGCTRASTYLPRARARAHSPLTPSLCVITGANAGLGAGGGAAVFLLEASAGVL